MTLLEEYQILVDELIRYEHELQVESNKRVSEYLLSKIFQTREEIEEIKEKIKNLKK